MPDGDLTQWQNWWTNSKAGNIAMPPHTTMSSITESPAHIEPIKPIKPIVPESRVPMEATKSKKKFFIPPELNDKKKKESTASEMWF